MSDVSTAAELDPTGEPHPSIAAGRDAPVLFTTLNMPSESLTGWVVVDSLVGPGAMGGTRMTGSVTGQEVCDLARAMTVKLGLVGLPIGGAKAGIRAAPVQRERVLRAFGRAVAPLLHGGVYLGTDQGTSHADRDVFFAEAGYDVERLPHATRLPTDWATLWRHVRDITGFGVVTGALTALGRTSGIRPRRVTIQGFGTVGRAAADHLARHGHRVVAVADVCGTISAVAGLPVDHLREITDVAGTIDRSRLPAQVATDARPEAWLDIDTDLIVLAAGGDAIRVDNISRVRAELVVEGGNLCVTPDAACRLRESGRVVVPGVVANVGGAAVTGCVVTGTAPSDLPLAQLVHWLYDWVGTRIQRNTLDLFDIGAGQNGDPVAELLAGRRAGRAGGAVTTAAGPRTRPAAGADWSRLAVGVVHTRMAPQLRHALAGVPGLRTSNEPDGATEALIGYHFPAGSLAGRPGLRWVHLTGTGTDHLARAGLPAGVLVTTSASVPVTAVAEYAVAGLLLLAKDLVEVAAGHAKEWFASRASLLAGTTVAVVGAGRIGRAVVTRLAALDAHPVAVTRSGAPPVPAAVRTVAVDRLAAEAPAVDHLIACLPGGSGTAGLVSAEVLAALPPHATVVNVGRAGTLDTGALYDRLRVGQLRGAFLDVHEIEPLPPDHPAWTVPGLVVSPHRAFAFPGEADAVAATFLDNLDDLRRGRTPRSRAPWPPEGDAP